MFLHRSQLARLLRLQRGLLACAVGVAHGVVMAVMFAVSSSSAIHLMALMAVMTVMPLSALTGGTTREARVITLIDSRGLVLALVSATSLELFCLLFASSRMFQP